MAKRGRKPIPKTQKEIESNLYTPYDKTQGNPNKFQSDLKNRGNQVSFKGDKVKPFNLGFEEIDEAITYYINNVIQPTIIQNGVVQKVPLIYGSPERWKQLQKQGYYRDKNGKIMMPLISFQIKSIKNIKNISTKLDANFPHNNIQIFAKTYDSKNRYDKFNILHNRVPNKIYYPIVIPNYVELKYDFIISTYYIEQMNKIIEAINYASDSYWGFPEKYKFRAKIDSFSPNISLPLGEERIVKSTFSLQVYGYIIPNNIQKELNSFKKINSRNNVSFTTKVVSDINNIS